MAVDNQEEAWRAQLERLGETAVRSDLELPGGVRIGMTSDAMQQFAFRWVREKETQRARREFAAFSYVKWTFWAAIAAAAIGIIGIATTMLGGHP
jgi:hypothetical protein